MFSVLFEVHPKPAQWDAYLNEARMLKPELEQVDGFVDNIRYRSLTREGWILSLSGWRDEKAVVRWRARMRHHEAQEKGRSEILLDYHLRVGEVTRDTQPPRGQAIREQRLDETEIGAATAVILIDAKRSPDWIRSADADEVALSLGLDREHPGLVGWDVFDAVLTPGDVILMASLRDPVAAAEFEQKVSLHDGTRLRRVRVVRDYGMFDRREAPQYFPAAPPPDGARQMHGGDPSRSMRRDMKPRPLSLIDSWHAHVYFEASSRDAARALRETIETELAGAMEMGRFHEKPVGPHPMWSYQLAFPALNFSQVVGWLALNHGALDVFVHPNTGDALRDHRDAALWLGKSYALNLAALMG